MAFIRFKALSFSSFIWDIHQLFPHHFVSSQSSCFHLKSFSPLTNISVVRCYFHKDLKIFTLIKKTGKIMVQNFDICMNHNLGSPNTKFPEYCSLSSSCIAEFTPCNHQTDSLRTRQGISQMLQIAAHHYRL